VTLHCCCPATHQTANPQQQQPHPPGPVQAAAVGLALRCRLLLCYCCCCLLLLAVAAAALLGAQDLAAETLDGQALAAPASNASQQPSLGLTHKTCAYLCEAVSLDATDSC
jgi:hypothetical protein